MPLNGLRIELTSSERGGRYRAAKDAEISVCLASGNLVKYVQKDCSVPVTVNTRSAIFVITKEAMATIAQAVTVDLVFHQADNLAQGVLCPGGLISGKALVAKLS